MADPLLTSLCTICHTNVPKYTCPACNAHTCSLPCTQKHKSWANCSGKRDPTAYIPASKLKTPAGVDHDYNFLSAIDRQRERNQRDIVDEKKLFSEREVREMDEPNRFRRMWFGEEVRFVVNDRTRAGQRDIGSDGENDDEGNNDGKIPHKASVLARKVRARLEQANVEVVHMPIGMARQRENMTAWNRKAAKINWCVEWIIFEDKDDLSSGRSTRVRHKALETTPLYKALGNSMAWYHRGQTKDEQEDDEDEELSIYARRKVLIKEVKEDGRRSAMQDPPSATWVATPYSTQNPYTGTWDMDKGASITSWLPDEETDARRHHRFYLLKPMTPLGKPKELIPVESTETLAKALQGRAVLEYPTLYIFPPSLAAPETPDLPEGFILGSTERRQRQRQRKTRSEKRKAGDKGDRSQQPNKRQAVGEGITPRQSGRNQRGRGGARGRGRGGRFQHQRQHGVSDAEEGEINSDGDEFRPGTSRPTADPADTTSSDPDTSADEESSASENEGAMDVDGPPEAVKSEPVARPALAKKQGLGLVGYGSDSDEDSGDDVDDDEGVDLSKMHPENPELVAGAIKEIVGLLS